MVCFLMKWIIIIINILMTLVGLNTVWFSLLVVISLFNFQHYSRPTNSILRLIVFTPSWLKISHGLLPVFFFFLFLVGEVTWKLKMWKKNNVALIMIDFGQYLSHKLFILKTLIILYNIVAVIQYRWDTMNFFSWKQRVAFYITCMELKSYFKISMGICHWQFIKNDSHQGVTHITVICQNLMVREGL